MRRLASLFVVLAVSVLDAAPVFAQAAERESDPYAVLWFFLAAAIFVALVALIFLTLAPQSRRPAIRILDAPDGDEPEPIRAAWVGLTLPLAAPPHAPRAERDPPSTPETYFVDADDALRALHLAAPEIADWWRSNAPKVNRAGYQFAFPAKIVEVVDPNRLTPGEVVGAELYDNGKNKQCSRCGLIQPSDALLCGRCQGRFAPEAP